MMKKRFYITLLFLFIVSFVSFSLSGCSLLLKKNRKPVVYKNNVLSKNNIYKPVLNYKSALNYVTKKINVYNYNKLSTVMFLRATYFNNAFIYAYTKKYSKYYLLNNKTFKIKLNKLYRTSNKYVKFFISVYTPNIKYNNFDSNRSIWMIYLSNNKKENVLPLKIKPAEQKRAFLKAFFPYITKWSKQYIIEFPRYYDKKKKELMITRKTKWLKLTITGVKGRAILKWNLTPIKN
ncbi:MAG: hypothetical protein EVG15_08150 [Candidatus Acididesulfobacter diazotrophicus]|jgi:hypothetical protein|uniref:Lipoprotein n=1 Tax=Candidatus Acididesulfobacter diazotrophicus TaxID=2597226 RepID=A0A519BL75_9DELT|nr:MAG: hypothetical protein EVG15_08150 [Candidatus Acididesulfobacter diazotrophicus]